MAPETARTDGLLGRLARLCFRRRRLVVIGWLVGVVAAVLLRNAYGATPDNTATGSDSPSARAQLLIEKHFPERQGDTLVLAVKAENGVDDAGVRPTIEKVLADLESSTITGPIISPYDAKELVTADRRIARTTIPLTVKEPDLPAVKALVDTVTAASTGGLTLGLGGEQAEKAETPEQGSTESVGLLAAAIILFLAFGSLVAMGLPIVTGVLAVLGGTALMKLVGHLVPSPDFTVLVAGLIGLGVGIDYALFILTRYKDCLQAGDDPENATVTAIATAGRAVLFAGTTVVIALLGLLAMGQRLMNGVAVGASVTVLVTMAAAVTLVPALLGFAGQKIHGLRVPRRVARGRDMDPAAVARRPLAERWAAVVQRRPRTAALVASAGLLLLAAPALSMRMSLPDASVQPHDRSSYIAYEVLSDGFGPGFAAPLVFATENPAGTNDLQPVVEAVRAADGIAYVTSPQVSADGEAALFMAFPTTGYQDEKTTAVVHTLRDDVLPRAPGGSAVYLGGPNAATIDFAEDVSERLPLMIGVVIVLSLLLLVALVRSVTIALQAAVMNLLSIGAAYGVLVAVVQWGWLGSALGFPTTMPVTTWVPMMMFPLLFGLSMDYEVFLISRIREEYERSGDTRAAVTAGLASTAKVITAAAAIMIAIFTTALLGADVSVRQIGLGMAAAVLIDATVVRMILVPAVMELCGKANWWMPGRPRRQLSAQPVS